MKKKYLIINEEFEAIKEAISEVLNLWNYDFIEANNEDGTERSMSKETFFKSLKSEFIIKGQN